MISKRAVLVLAGVFCVAGCAALLLGNTGGARLESNATLSISSSTTATTSALWYATNLSTTGFRGQAGACGTRMIVVRWNAPSGADEGATFKYILLRNGYDVYLGSNRTFSDTGLQPSVTYTYSLAVMRTSDGQYSTPVVMTAESPADCTDSEDSTASTTTTGTNTSGTGTASSSASTTPRTETATSSVSDNRVTTEVVPRPIMAATLTPALGTISTPTPAPTPTPPNTQPPSVVRDLPVATSTPLPVPATPEVAAKAKVLTTTISSVIEVQASAETAKAQLTKLINETIDRATNQPGANATELEKLRLSLTAKIQANLDSPFGIATGDAAKAADEVGKALAGVPGAHPSVAGAATSIAADATAAPDVALLYTDSNKDGISDYDAIHVFNMDPKATAPTTVVGKKVYTPEAKVLAGYDPSKKELVRVFPEEPTRSSLPPTKAYTVDSVALATTTKALSFSGKALPNSFITIYIFSTPVVVTVKTDANGSWNYTLDRELENGLHTVETATVDNTGRILAKSQPFPFTKTAQAASLEAMPLPAAAEKPTLLSGMNFYIVFGLSTLVFFLALVYVGIDARRREALQTADETPSGPPVS